MSVYMSEVGECVRDRALPLDVTNTDHPLKPTNTTFTNTSQYTSRHYTQAHINF